MVNKKRHKIKQTKVVDATVKFIMWFEHFIKTVQPQARDSPTLLILDGHASHVRNLDLIEKVRDNNVLQLCLPCHCTHRLQPLDVSFFKSRNWHYDEEIRNWMHEHDGRRITEYDVAGIFGHSLRKSSYSPERQKCGIFPLRKDLFTDEDFLGADFTDNRLPPAESTQYPTTNNFPVSVSDNSVLVSPSQMPCYFQVNRPPNRHQSPLNNRHHRRRVEG